MEEDVIVDGETQTLKKREKKNGRKKRELRTVEILGKVLSDALLLFSHFRHFFPLGARVLIELTPGGRFRPGLSSNPTKKKRCPCFVVQNSVGDRCCGIFLCGDLGLFFLSPLAP